MKIRTLSFLAFAVTAAACGGKQETSSPAAAPAEPAAEPAAEAPAAPAQIRFVHVANTPPARFAAAGESIGDALDPFTFARERVAAPAGDHELTVRPAGGGPALGTGAVTFEAGGSYTVVAAGSSADGAQVFAIADTFDEPAEGMAAVRFVHAVPGGPRVGFASPEGRGYVAGLDFGEASGWYEIAEADNVVNTTAGGDTIATATLPLRAGTHFTVVVRTDGDGVSFLTIAE